MTLGNQFFLYESHVMYSVIRIADHSYRGAKTTYNRLIKELALLIFTPSAFTIKHILRYINSRTKNRIKQMDEIKISKNNFEVFKSLHDKIRELTADSRIYNIEQVPANLVSTVKEINNFMTLLDRYEKSLRLKLYPSDFKGASLEKILEQRKRLEAFAEDWDDEGYEAYDIEFLAK